MEDPAGVYVSHLCPKSRGNSFKFRTIWGRVVYNTVKRFKNNLTSFQKLLLSQKNVNQSIIKRSRERKIWKVLLHSEQKFELSRFPTETYKGGDARKVKPVSLASKTLMLAAALEAGKSRIQIIVQPRLKPKKIMISLNLWTIRKLPP